MTITITSPTDYQVFQRDSDNVADIAISGTYTGSPVAIEAQFNGGAFATIDASPSGGTFSGTLSGQAAGQGILTVRFTDTPATLDTVTYVGVGDVFLVAGQSNAAGFGTDSQVYSHATLKAGKFTLNDTVWAELSDPATYDADGSPWPLLATRVMASTGYPVAFITTGVSGTGLNSTGEWEQGGAQYEDCLTTLTNSGVNTVRAILWFQGETEVNQADTAPSGKTEAYMAALSQMLDDMYTDAPILDTVPLVAGQIGYKTSSGSTRTGIDPIRVAQQLIWDDDPDILQGPITYDIDLSDSDGVHFGQGADGGNELQTLANRWWRMIYYHFFGGSQGRTPRFYNATRSGTTVTVTFNGGLPLTGQTDITGWRFTDNGSVISVVSAIADGDNRVILTLTSLPTGVELISYGSGNDAAGALLKDTGTYPMPPELFINKPVLSGVAGGDFAFFVDIEDAAGNKLGSGPLTSVTKWSYTARFDRAGTISFDFAGSDPQASYVTNRCIARAWARLGDYWTEVGAGVVDSLSVSPDSQGRVTVNASGLDLIRELSYRTVGKLEVGRGTGTTHETAIEAVAAYAPPGWTIVPSGAPGHDYAYARFGGESVLGAYVDLADKSQTHFYRASGRTLIFTSAFSDSGVRAIEANGDLATGTCAIVSLKRTVDTHDLLTRIYPYGSGTGDARLTLAATTRTAAAGYTLNKAANYIERDAATAAYGLVDHPEIEFKEITPIANTTADVRAAANLLFDAAVDELERRSTLADQETYDVRLADCDVLLRPMQTIRLVKRDISQGIDVNDDLYILEATWEVDSNQVRTSRLVVSTDARWPDSDASVAAERAVQGRVFQAHPQIGPNSYWENATLYIGSDQAEHIAEFPFVLGDEVVNIQQARFRFKITEPLSFISVVAGSAEFDIAVDVNVDDVDVTGTINISHTHTIPNHQHTFTIIGNGAGALTYDIGYGAGGTAGGMRHNINSTDHVISTNAASGGTTSDSGGSASLALSGSGTGTGTGTTTVDLSNAIATSYGVYRAPTDRTYDIDDLEYRVNGGAWADLNEGESTGDGYYEIDITDDVQDPDTFRPLQENNLIEIRRTAAAGALPLNSSQGDGLTVGISTSPTHHNLTVGEIVIVSGTVHHDGTWTIVEVTNETVFRVNQTGDSNTEGAVGQVEINKSAMIYAKLGIRTTIQAVALT